jgi:hypothetical protein
MTGFDHVHFWVGNAKQAGELPFASLLAPLLSLLSLTLPLPPSPSLSLSLSLSLPLFYSLFQPPSTSPASASPP